MRGRNFLRQKERFRHSQNGRTGVPDHVQKLIDEKKKRVTENGKGLQIILMTAVSERGTIDYKKRSLSEDHSSLFSFDSHSLLSYYKGTGINDTGSFNDSLPFLDYGRYFHKSLAEFISRFFGFMMRRHERDGKKKNLSGATYVLILAVVVIVIFPKIFVVTSFAVLIVGDIAAALIGRKFGRNPIFVQKS